MVLPSGSVSGAACGRVCEGVSCTSACFSSVTWLSSNCWGSCIILSFISGWWRLIKYCWLLFKSGMINHFPMVVSIEPITVLFFASTRITSLNGIIWPSCIKVPVNNWWPKRVLLCWILMSTCPNPSSVKLIFCGVAWMSVRLFEKSEGTNNPSVTSPRSLRCSGCKAKLLQALKSVALNTNCLNIFDSLIIKWRAIFYECSSACFYCCGS